jgi:hypothetical protein
MSGGSNAESNTWITQLLAGMSTAVTIRGAPVARICQSAPKRWRRVKFVWA